jgi:hypothetical protein
MHSELWHRLVTIIADECEIEEVSAESAATKIERMFSEAQGYTFIREISPLVPTTVKGEISWHISDDYRAALESVEPSRPVRVVEGGKRIFDGTAGELLALAPRE